MSQLLAAQELQRVFTFKQNGKEIDLPDFNPLLAPQDIVKYYAGQYPELTNANIETPKYEGEKMVFGISTKVGTKG